jgi:hypothetical protein
MWDLALTYAVSQPQWTTTKSLARPPENGGRPIKVVTDIDAAAMEAHFWALLKTLPEPSVATKSHVKQAVPELVDPDRQMSVARRFGGQCRRKERKHAG